MNVLGRTVRHQQWIKVRSITRIQVGRWARVALKTRRVRADLGYMTSAEAPPYNAAVIEKLIKQHGDRLHPQETFISALRGGAVDRVQPGAVFGMLGAIGRRMERSLSEDQIGTRAAQVKLFLHRRGLELIEFPSSKVGYTLALTERRVAVFNFPGRRFLSESPIRGMRVEQLRHADDMSTLFFCEGRQAAAITSWEDPELTAHFVTAYNAQATAATTRRAS